MNIVIPMAGRGRRFAGYAVPKPLIAVRGRPMVWWALQGLPAVSPDRLVFIVAEDQVTGHAIDERLRLMSSPGVRVVIQSSPTQGQADTVLAARDIIDRNDPLLIHNCDTYAPGIGTAIRKTLAEHLDTDGLVPVFGATDPGLSYVALGPDGCAIEVAEKQVISNHASTGTYYFRRGRDFVWAADRMIRDELRARGEYYVLPAYNYLIRRGMKIRIVRLDAVHVLGTPEDLARFERG